MLQESLTPRQFQVLDLLAEGLTDPQIAKQLGISHRTVEKHNRDVYSKLSLRNRTEAMLLYMQAKKSLRVRNRNYKNQHN